MRPSQLIECPRFPCAGVKHNRFVVPEIEIKSNKVSFVLVSEAASVDLSDYYLRHPDLRVANNTAIDMSDYYLRHPDLRVSTSTAIDMSDYFLRHPELIVSTGAAQRVIDCQRFSSLGSEAFDLTARVWN